MYCMYIWCTGLTLINFGSVACLSKFGTNLLLPRMLCRPISKRGGKITKSVYCIRHVCLSVRPHTTTGLSLEGCYEICVFFEKLLREFKIY
jgi:hypothetical protein